MSEIGNDLFAHLVQCIDLVHGRLPYFAFLGDEGAVADVNQYAKVYGEGAGRPLWLAVGTYDRFTGVV